MSKQDGGSAFPQVKTTKQYTTDPDIHSVGGMTLRDYFAAKAIQGLCVEAGKGTISTFLDGAKVAAELAYAQADAMLAAREVAQ